MSISTDFYFRVIVRVVSAPIQAKLAMTRCSYFVQSTAMPSFALLPVGIAKRAGKEPAAAADSAVDDKSTPKKFSASHLTRLPNVIFADGMKGPLHHFNCCTDVFAECGEREYANGRSDLVGSHSFR